MASVNVISSSQIGTSLTALLMADDIVPGAEPSYQTCKTIYLYHPLGQKMAEAPIKMAQFLPREIIVSTGPEEALRKAFEDQWKRDEVEKTIRNFGTQSRVYGIASLAVLLEKGKPGEPLEVKRLADAEIAFNVLDPINTAGSLVLSQDPNAVDFQKHGDIAVNGVVYHRSRTVTLMNEQPIYIAYTSSSFGFVGRSCYQRALYPLKSFINTMIADDMVARKSGLIVAMLKQAGSIVDAVMNAASAFKRRLLKVAETDNVISVGLEEKVESLDLTNLDGPLSMARKHILENIAAAADMPAKLLNNETFAEGFGEGVEDAKAVAAYVDGIRAWLTPAYRFMDNIVQRRAWNPRFYEALKNEFPEKGALGGDDYESCFYAWQNAFNASWPSLLREPESEQVRVADTKLKGLIAATEVLLPILDPENKARAIEWLVDGYNSTKELFSGVLELDMEEFRNYVPPEPSMGEEGDVEGESGPMKEPKAGKPFSDSARGSVAAYLGREDNGDLRKRVLRLEDHVVKGTRK